MNTPPKSSAKVYRDAAVRMKVGHNSYSCLAIDASTGDYVTAKLLIDFYTDLFRPIMPNAAWWPIDQTEPRILALLLAAEIVERGGL